jgi:hypothetical protein
MGPEQRIQRHLLFSESEGGDQAREKRCESLVAAGLLADLGEERDAMRNALPVPPELHVPGPVAQATRLIR